MDKNLKWLVEFSRVKFHLIIIFCPEAQGTVENVHLNNISLKWWWRAQVPQA